MVVLAIDWRIAEVVPLYTVYNRHCHNVSTSRESQEERHNSFG